MGQTATSATGDNRRHGTIRTLLLAATLPLIAASPALAEREVLQTPLASHDERHPDLVQEVLYHTMEPAIITNYLTADSSIGFIRVQISLMLLGPKALELVQHHEPLLTNAIIEVLGRQPSWRIRDLNAREDLRQECHDIVRQLLKTESGYDVVQDLMFAEYLYY